MSWRAFALRRIMGRLRVGDDILRHLTTFQRLGAPMDVTPPREVLPLGARTVLRAVRTGATIDITPAWLWPRWLEQQRNPTSPAFVPRGHLPTVQNVTHRNWTAVGAPGIAHEAIVDASGLVTPAFDGWSLDWWAHDGHRWRFPSREPTVRQRLLGPAPVTSTELPLDDGHVEQRAWAVETVPGVVCVELVNHTPRRLDMAFGVRPANPEGLAVVESLRLDGDVAHVDDQRLLRFESVPDRALVSSYDDGDSALRLAAGETASPTAATCRAGLAQGAFVYALEPGASVRAVAALGGRAPRTRWRLPGRRRTRATLPGPRRLPSADDVVGEWGRRLDRGLRVELPDDRLQEAVDANRAHLLALHDPGDITAGPFTYHRFWFRDAAYQLAALDRWGFHDEAADVLRRYPQRQRGDGMFHSQWREWDTAGAAIWALAEHDRLTGDAALRARALPAVLAGARWILDMCADDRGKEPAGRGLLPAGISAEHFGPFDAYFWDDMWAWRGLVDAAELARRHGVSAAAEPAAAGAATLRATLMGAIARSAQQAERPAITAGPDRGVDAGMIGGLAACYPLGMLSSENPWITATADVLRERFTLGPAFYQGIAHTGLGTYLTLQLAFVELFSGDLRAWDRLMWLLDVATPTWTWPEAVHPILLGGCMGDGHHGWASAELLNFVRMLLVREDGRGLALLSILPPAWRGERVVVRDAPTHHGALSYELRWDGDDAWLRWELGQPGATISAPGLDPGWSTDDSRGEVRFRP